MDTLDFETVAADLEERAAQLNKMHDASVLGNDQIVYSIAQFVRAIGGANEAAATFTKRLFILTVVLVLFGVAQIAVALFDLFD